MQLNFDSVELFSLSRSEFEEGVGTGMFSEECDTGRSAEGQSGYTILRFSAF